MPGQTCVLFTNDPLANQLTHNVGTHRPIDVLASGDDGHYFKGAGLGSGYPIQDILLQDVNEKRKGRKGAVPKICPF